MRARSTETLIALALVLLTGCSMFQKPAPETVARDLYRATKVACEVYERLPGERHSAEMDRTCRSLRLVCSP
jgi:hypothetical protein